MPVHTLKLVSFLSSTKTELSHGKVAPSWRDLFAGTGTSSVTPFSGFSSQVLSAAIAWSILRMPDVFISRTFGHTSLETIQLRCIGKGHVVLILSSTPNSQFPPIPLRQASTNAATYLSKVIAPWRKEWIIKICWPERGDTNMLAFHLVTSILVLLISSIASWLWARNRTS